MGIAGIAATGRRPLDALPALTQFLNRRHIQDAQRRNKSKLSPEGHQTLRDKLSNSGPISPNDADTTKSNICNIKKKWLRYCKYTGEEDWRRAIHNCDKGATMSFLRFICENDRVKSKESLHQYLKQFKMLYSRVNGQSMNTNDARDVYEYLRGTLVEEFGLNTSVKLKPVLGLDDILLLLTHHWARDTCIFLTEDQRVAFAAILLLSIYTGCRPAELVDGSKNKAARQGSWDDPDDPGSEDPDCEGQDLKEGVDPDYDRPDPWEDIDDASYNDDIGDLSELMREYKAICYEDVRVWIVQNPTHGERDLVAIEITLSHHKGANKKPKPTTFLFHEEVLPILCPISHILTLAIRDDAFEVDGLRSAKPFFTTNLKNPMKAMKVHWKPSMLKVPIFRQAVRTADGFQTSKRKCLPYSTYAHYLNRLGWEAGFAEKLTSYCMRRGTGNAVDGAATTAVRDQVMRHDPKSGIFNGAYLNEKVRFDVQSAFLERPSIDGLTRAFTHMSLTCDPRAPKEVLKEVMDALPPDPAIVELEAERKELYETIRKRYGFVNRARGTKIGKEYQTLVRRIGNAKQKRHNDIKKQYRQDYHYRIHNEEMERQLKKIVTDEYVAPVIQHQLLERTQLQEVMCDFSEDLTTEDIVRRRICAVNLMVALCSRREVQRPKLRSITTYQQPIKEESPDIEPFPLLCVKTQCPICIGDERMTYTERIFCYRRPSHMMDHVERAHRGVLVEKTISCRHPVCKSSGLVLKNLMHFKNHVQTVHGISLRA